MAGILMSPEIDIKMSKRIAIYKKCRESPKLREMLRERFRSGFKSRRQDLLNRFRNIRSNDEVHGVLSTIIQEEVTILGEEITIEEMETGEIIETSESEFFEQIMSEYEKVLDEEFNRDWKDEVVCPICEKCMLKLTDGSVTCAKCSSHFPPVPSLGRMRDILMSSVKDHEKSCREVSQFALINDRVTNGLFLICQYCNYFTQTL